MGQQFFVIRNMPQPGSPAFHARQERLKKKGKLTESEPEAQPEAESEASGPEAGQRQQPVSKNRAKKKKKK
jgi:YidC/Oxa1 family membrane protein insertase